MALTASTVGRSDPLPRAPAAGAPVQARVESLVRETWYEGLPFSVASQLTAADVVRLATMLADPAEAAHHGDIVMALGMSGLPDAFAPLAAFAAAPLSGEVDRATYRARVALPQALGHLARSDPRALDWLLAAAGLWERSPGWTFRHLRGAALAAVLQEQTLLGLGISGAPEATAVLQRAAASPDARTSRHARNVQALHDRVAAYGAQVVFDGSGR